MRHTFTFALIAAAWFAGCDRSAEIRDGDKVKSGTSYQPIPGTPPGDLGDWVSDIRTGIAGVPRLAATNPNSAQQITLDLYITRQEYIEMYYGAGGRVPTRNGLAGAIETAEERFHEVMKLFMAGTPSVDVVTATVGALDAQQALVDKLWRESGASLSQLAAGLSQQSGQTPPAGRIERAEIRALSQQLADATAAYRASDAARARALVDAAYLDGFEPLEARLPRDIVERVERAIHFQLRPAISRGESVAIVSAIVDAVVVDLARADRFLASGGSKWFAVINSFVIIVREGLEAVLLIAALLAYLSAIGAHAKHRRQIYAGVAAGVVASVGTWFLASTLLPISGANRELIEGATALIAVAVLLYVAHWLFQKTYIHDWKDYLRSRVGGALSRGSAFAMVMLAFAAVYREGFETVLFYQALAFDAGIMAILGGFIPGALLILALGFAIIRAGLKLPLKKVFAATNAVLLYLAFVFMGKGLYNLQEAGLFTAHPLPLPDHPALRQLLGFYPLVETIGAQLAFVGLLAATFVVARGRRDLQIAPLPAPHGAARPA